MREAWHILAHESWIPPVRTTWKHRLFRFVWPEPIKFVDRCILLFIFLSIAFCGYMMMTRDRLIELREQEVAYLQQLAKSQSTVTLTPSE
jgi:hypothetical protein